VCLIVDANLATKVFVDPPKPEFEPVLNWLREQGGYLVVGGRLATELARVGKPWRFIRELLRSGHARQVRGEAVEREETVVVATGHCRSNDAHVIALARVSGARTLCTDDGDLRRDFRNAQLVSNPRGSIYIDYRKAHLKLLRHTSSCGKVKKGRRR
jgi:predicted nucleic acid-binding protein